MPGRSRKNGHRIRGSEGRKLADCCCASVQPCGLNCGPFNGADFGAHWADKSTIRVTVHSDSVRDCIDGCDYTSPIPGVYDLPATFSWGECGAGYSGSLDLGYNLLAGHVSGCGTLLNRITSIRASLNLLGGSGSVPCYAEASVSFGTSADLTEYGCLVALHWQKRWNGWSDPSFYDGFTLPAYPGLECAFCLIIRGYAINSTIKSIGFVTCVLI